MFVFKYLGTRRSAGPQASISARPRARGRPRRGRRARVRIILGEAEVNPKAGRAARVCVP